MKQVIDFLKAAWLKLKDWWNQQVDDEVLIELTEKYGVNIPDHELYVNPFRRLWESQKSKIAKSVGKGGFLALVGCFGVLTFIIFTGGHSMLAVTGVAIATIYSAMIAISRFPWLEKLIGRFYKIIDLALFTFMFLAAETIFGLQVAAISGVLCTIALIFYKVWTDEKIKQKAEEMVIKAKEVKDEIMNAVEAEFTEVQTVTA